MTSLKNLPDCVFLFILDAVRKDHLSFYGYQRKTSPNIDQLTQQSNVYYWAFAPSSYTIASIPSIIAGKYPIEISNLFTAGKFINRDFAILKKIKKLGYKTAMFTAGIVLSHFQTNLNKFFDFFDDKLTEKELNRPNFLFQKAEKVLKNVQKFINKNKHQKLFIIVHLMDVHGPYSPSFPSIFTNDCLYQKEKRKITRVVNNMFSGVDYKLLKKNLIVPEYQLLNLISGPNGEIEDFEKNIKKYLAQYDMGIYLLDKQLGYFFSYLKKSGKFNSSLIALTADHGELLGEENIFFSHGIDTRPALINVPLIIKKPFQSEKKTIKKNYSLINLVRHIFKLEKNYFRDKCVYSFHPKSVSLIKKNKIFMAHIGNLDLIDNKNCHFFRTSLSKKTIDASQCSCLNFFKWKNNNNKIQLISKKINCKKINKTMLHLIKSSQKKQQNLKLPLLKLLTFK